MLKSYLIGREAENSALEWFLSQKKARLLARNYRCYRGEIDLIFEELTEEKGRQNRDLVFVEVKARTHRSWFDGPQSVGWHKRQSLRRTVDRYLLTYQGSANRIRFDLLYWDGKIWQHFPNLWILDD